MASIGGAAFGILMGAADGDDVCEPGSWCLYQMSREEEALAGGVVFGTLGGVGGGIVGATRPGERWQRVSTPSRWAIAPTRSGGIAVMAWRRR